MHHTLLWTIFAGFMALFLIVDLGWLNRRPHVVSTRSAALQTLFWVVASLIYAGCVWRFSGAAPASDFVAAWLTEKMLSVDNLFVILLIFGYFRLDDALRHRALYWGILGAVVLRAIFIGGGTALVGRFHWILYLFGAFLVWSGAKLLFAGDDDESVDIEHNRVLGWCRRHGLSTFMTVVLVVETTDLLFAFDSIPAVLAITQDPLIAFTSNIFAVMGLRSIFFLVESLMKRLPYLKQGVSAVLIFIGAKMLAAHWIHIGSLASLAGIVAILGVAAALSAWKNRQDSLIPNF